jgi:transposase
MVDPTPNAEGCPNCVRLEAELAALRADYESLKGQFARLQAQLAQTSRNSHMPPSSDRAGAKRRKKKRVGKRRPGGQPGHGGRARELLPLDAVDQTVPCRPASCGECGASLHGDDPSPERHQVVEIPEPRPRVTEYQLHRLHCARCGSGTRGSLPEGVGYSGFGPRLHACVAILGADYRLSKRGIQRLLADWLGVDLALGSISNMEATVSRALAAPVEEARQVVRSQQVAHLDETGWWQQNGRAWLWAAVTSLLTVFAIRRSRGGDVAREMLGDDFEGVAVSDRWSGYSWLDVLQRQLCWAHLKRDFTKMAEASGAISLVGHELLGCTRELFEWWHRVRDGTLERPAFETHVLSDLRWRVEALLEQGAGCDHEKLSGVCRSILALEPAMWTFVRLEGIEPTNNCAERALRPGVILRKVSFGTQSQRGSTFLERILTVTASLRQQGRRVLDYVTDACSAHFRRLPAPSLIPA